MNEDACIVFFRATVVGVARTMSVPDAANFLRGCLAIAGEHESLSPVRDAYLPLCSADAQLELIAGPQMRLPLANPHDLALANPSPARKPDTAEAQASAR